MKEFLKLEILNKEPNIELLILEPAFICRKCIPSKIFDSEDELRTHQGEGGHRFEAKRVKNLSLGVLGKSLLASMPIQQVNQPVKELTIIKNNTTCVAVPLFELFDKSGALAEINNRIKSINLKCHIVKETGEELNLLEFEPAFMCRQCTNKIFDTEEELKEHRKKDEMERKKYLDEISNPYEKRQQEHDKYLKSRDRPR